MKDGTVSSRIDRLIYCREDARRRSKSRSRERSYTESSPSVGRNSIAILDTNPLQQAVFRGCVECIRMLVEMPPYCSVDKTCGPEGLRPIHIAAREGHLSVLRFLASAGGDVDKCDAHGSTGLHHAAWGGQLRAARWLLRHGASLTLDKRGKSPIQVAADLGHTEIVALLTNHSSCGTVHPEIASTKELNSSNYTVASTSAPLGDHCHRKLRPEIPHESNRKSPRPNRSKTLLRGNANSKYLISSKAQSPQDLSSSGNFSLATTATSSGSNSPSASRTAAAACTTCADLAQAGGTTEQPTPARDSINIIGVKQSKIDTSPTVASFYLHPPRSLRSASPIETPREHRQVTVSVAVEPFYLHPPSGDTSPLTQASDEEVRGRSQEESLAAIAAEMGPVTPVASSSDFLTSSDPIPDEEKLEESQSSQPNSGSATPTPPTPPPKAPRVLTHTLKASTDNPPPPPPPPPMPKLPEKPRSTRGTHSVPLRTLSQSNYSGEENEYEDIEDMNDDQSATAGNGNRKLNRSISAPAPPNRNSATDQSQALIQPKGVLPGSRRPFIPPNFPDPPQDALIKPSEYLKSIQQNKSKYEKGSGGAGMRAQRTSSRVEETIKVLNGDMTSVPEEPLEDEHEASAEHYNGDYKEESTGGIRLEELRKVNLRKTPMSRTLSAPVLGRVLSDNVGQNGPSPSEQRPPPAPGPAQPLNGKSVSGPPRAAIIAELAESSQVGGVREWKEELRRRQAEEEKAAAKEIASIYSPLKFVSEVPEADESGTPIPEWKRQMMAKKAAEKAKKEAEEQRKLEAEAKRASAIPPWKRQLLQRRDSDSKSAQ